MTELYSTRHWRERVRPAVLARDRWTCQVPGCGRPATEAGHRVAVVDGGALYDLTNLEAQCRSCNARDGARIGLRRARLGRPSRAW